MSYKSVPMPPKTSTNDFEISKIPRSAKKCFCTHTHIHSHEIMIVFQTPYHQIQTWISSHFFGNNKQNLANCVPTFQKTFQQFVRICHPRSINIWFGFIFCRPMACLETPRCQHNTTRCQNEGSKPAK